MSSPTHEEILREMADRKRNEARWFAKGAPEAAARALARAAVFQAGADALASRISVEDREQALDKAEEAGYDYMRMGASDLPPREYRRLAENRQRCMREARSLLRV